MVRKYRIYKTTGYCNEKYKIFFDDMKYEFDNTTMNYGWYLGINLLMFFISNTERFAHFHSIKNISDRYSIEKDDVQIFIQYYLDNIFK